MMLVERIAEAMRAKLVADDDTWAYADGSDFRCITLDGSFDLTELAQIAVDLIAIDTLNNEA